jgi:hypothetical protein
MAVRQIGRRAHHVFAINVSQRCKPPSGFALARNSHRSWRAPSIDRSSDNVNHTDIRVHQEGSEVALQIDRLA